MQTMTEGGRNLIADIAARHGVSTAVTGELMAAIAAGGGHQAQFDQPELGGMGQWSQGGMIMIGDMFNHRLKAQVAALCDDLAAALADDSPFANAPDRPAAARGNSDTAAGGRWPVDLGRPGASGSQNDMHYAVFPETRRLAIEQHERMTVYDTGDHRIGGVAQQQSADQSLQFTSQSGPIRLSDLPIVTA